MKMDLCIIFIAVFYLIPTSATAAKPLTLNQEGHKGDCDFEENLCPFWANIDTDEFNWARHAGRTPSSGTGPDWDHTRGGNDKGHYLYIETSLPRQLGQQAKLISKTLNGVFCLSFFYHMFGITIGSLDVITNDGYISTKLFNENGNKGNRWIGTNMTVYGIDFRVIIVGTVGGSYTGDIAIDDIRFFPGSCDGRVINLKKLAEDRMAQSKEMCPFDLGLCGWSQDSFQDNFDWVLARFSDRRGTGPKRDHTGNVMGRYLSMDSRRLRGSKARIVSGRVCGEHGLSFAYYMFGRNVKDLIVYKQQDDTLDRIWKRSGNKGSKWHEMSLNIQERGCYKIVIEGVVGRFRRQGDIALDDLWLKKGDSCSLSSSSNKNHEIGNCTFDDGFCKWSNMRKDQFDWKIGSAKARNSQTGPNAASTGNKAGKYAYIDASEPRIKGDKAVLISDHLRGSLCLHFKYHMYGEDVGSLEIHQNNDGLPKIPLWKQKGNFGNIWHQGFVNTTCNALTEDYEIEITATVGGWRGDIAIDDVYFTSTSCPSSQLPPKVTNGKNILPPSFGGYCGFGKTFCGWVNGVNNDYFWRIHRGASPSVGTGPENDYDNNGRYAYLEASYAAPNATGELVSGWIYGKRCLRFFYHMFGKGVGELQVKQIGVKGNGTRIWARRGSQSSLWQAAVVTLSGQEYKVAFVGIRGADHRGDIALDAIRIRDGDCLSDVLGYFPKAPTPLIDCDFDDENDRFCGWQNANPTNSKIPSKDIKKEYTVKDEFDWARLRGPTLSANTGPSRDHTGGKDGHYIFIETSVPRKEGDKAILYINVEGQQDRVRCMRFYYHMLGTGMGSLEIQRDSPLITSKPEKLWSMKGNQGNDWREAEVNIPELPLYRLLIVGIRGRDYTGDIAVDDITFTDYSCNNRG